jgi:hypothetical protein
MNPNEVGTSKLGNASSVKEFICISAQLFAVACIAQNMCIVFGSEHLMLRALFTPQENFFCSFLLVAESTPEL